MAKPPKDDKADAKNESEGAEKKGKLALVKGLLGNKKILIGLAAAVVVLIGGLVMLAIDHILLDPRCAVRAVSTHKLPGTDHRALYAQIQLPR